MAITIQYGPIAGALGLAQQAGQGQAKFRQQQADLDFLNTVNAMQRTADSQHAQEIQQSLDEQRLAADNSQSQARLQQSAAQDAAENDYRNRALKSEDSYRTQSLQLGQQRVDTGQQNADTQQMRALAPKPGQDQTRLYYEELRRLDAAERQAVTDQQKSAYDPQDLNKMGAAPSKAMPNVISGMEALYTTAAQRLAAIQQRRQQIDAAVNGGSVLQPGQPAPQQINQGVVQQIAQQGGVMNPAMAAAQGGTPVIRTAQEFAQLPHGSKYINGNTGQMAMKP